MKSSAAIVMNMRVRRVMVVWFAKKFISVIFNMTSSRTQVNMRLAMIKNPPMAMLNLASFRIMSTRFPTSFYIKLLAFSQFNLFGSPRFWMQFSPIEFSFNNGTEKC
jgi:hypothetical protein